MTRYEVMLEALMSRPDHPRTLAVLAMREKIATMETLVDQGEDAAFAWRCIMGYAAL